MQFLAGSGADLNAKDQDQFTPLDVAMGKAGRTGRAANSPQPHQDTAELLQKLVANRQ